MEDHEISFLFADDEVYIVPDAKPGRTEINADLLFLVSTKGNKDNCEEIINRVLESLKPLKKNIEAQYDVPIRATIAENCKRIVAMGFSNEQTGLHAEFAVNKIFYFKEKYILLAEDIMVIDRDAGKKKQFWKLLQEILACGN